MRITPAVVFAICLTVIVIGAIFGGVSLIDSPYAARSKKIDQQRLTDLQAIERSVNQYVAKNQQLPDNLDQLRQTNLTIKVSDEAGAPYEYSHADTTSYQLCATFDLASNDTKRNDIYQGLLNLNGEWVHPSGHYCFNRTPPKLSQQTGGMFSRAPTTSQITPSSGQPEIPIPPAIPSAQTPPAAPSQPSANSVLVPSDASANSPAALGFQQYFKCSSYVVRLGDTITPASCLQGCKRQDQAVGCWWLDGTGGFPRDCRVCIGRAPARAVWANDWAMPISK